MKPLPQKKGFMLRAWPEYPSNASFGLLVIGLLVICLLIYQY